LKIDFLSGVNDSERASLGRRELGEYHLRPFYFKTHTLIINLKYIRYEIQIEDVFTNSSKTSFAIKEHYISFS